MTEDKPFNFIVGERWSSDDKPYEELVTICRFCTTYEVCKRCGRHVCEADGYHYLNHEREDFEIEFEKKFGISLVKLKRYFEDGFKP